MTTAVRCTKCDKWMPTQGRFCPHCGTERPRGDGTKTFAILRDILADLCNIKPSCIRRVATLSNIWLGGMLLDLAWRATDHTDMIRGDKYYKLSTTKFLRRLAETFGVTLTKDDIFKRTENLKDLCELIEAMSTRDDADSR